MKSIRLIILVCTLLAGRMAMAQADTLPPKSVTIIAPADTLKDSIGKKHKVFSPKKATIRSAIIPGWGQIYNRKYWKLPLVYGALGITGYVFFDNIRTFNDIDFAYKVSVAKDTGNYDKVASYLKPFVPNETTSLDNYRREFRRNIDYSVLVFLLFWGLNVVDATVDAHLHDFDVTPNLSMKLKPMLPAVGAGATNGTGLSLVFDLHKAKGRLISVQ